MDRGQRLEDAFREIAGLGPERHSFVKRTVHATNDNTDAGQAPSRADDACLRRRQWTDDIAPTCRTRPPRHAPGGRVTAPTPSPQPGMGAVHRATGTTFRVWAPHATAVAVVGSFNGWDAARHPLARDDGGAAETWSADVAEAGSGDEYRFVLQTPAGERNRIDPRARRLTNSVGNGIVYDPAAFDWGDVEFRQPPWNDLVIYELHVGTFSESVHGQPGTLDGVRRRLPYLKALGVGAIQLMPPFEFAGDRSWGYNTAYPFAVESTYGSPDDLKALVRAAHETGIAVILDVVYNHLGPSDLDIWQFDGWSQGGKGGIYFYEDDRSTTPWGDTRPDYGRAEVRAFLRDSAFQWLDEFRIDGLRWDATAWISSVLGGGNGAADRIEDGWRFMADVNTEIAERYPGRLTIAEDLRSDRNISLPRADGGAAFGAQWDGAFVHFVRTALVTTDDDDRDIVSVSGVIDEGSDGADAFARVIYTESHDEDANGSARVPEEIWPGYADSWASKKRATLGSAIVLTSPGIPMLFQGQELVEGSWFNDEDGLDWTLRHRHAGLLRLHRDLVSLRRNTTDVSRGLRGEHVTVHHVNTDAQVLGWHRWLEGGARDDVIVLANFSTDAFPDYHLGVPRAGRWRVRFNSDWDGYDPEFETVESLDADSKPEEQDGMAQRIAVGLGPYSVVILSQDD
jgi:1,4-alpha-glucan branching enzyme